MCVCVCVCFCFWLEEAGKGSAEKTAYDVATIHIIQHEFCIWPQLSRCSYVQRMERWREREFMGGRREGGRKGGQAKDGQEKERGRDLRRALIRK